jgi:hypothetical protein
MTTFKTEVTRRRSRRPADPNKPAAPVEAEAPPPPIAKRATKDQSAAIKEARNMAAKFIRGR